MARRTWIVLQKGRVKRWKGRNRDALYGRGVPPYWYRNALNRRERRRAFMAMHRGDIEASPYVHPRCAPSCW